MSVPCEKMIPFGLPNYRQLICDYDAASRTLWYYLNPQPRACFTPELLGEIRDLQQRVAAHLAARPDDIHYLILASAKPNVFNLGGDLELFTASIKSAD